jgi:hypothetical protein
MTQKDQSAISKSLGTKMNIKIGIKLVNWKKRKVKRLKNDKTD